MQSICELFHDSIAAAVREGGAEWPSNELRMTERHLQCVWFDGRLRPDGLRTDGGEAVEVVSPGMWNLEAGPDFLGAELLAGESRRKVRGDVEVHIRPSDWRAHGHASDPRYANVVLHLTYFPALAGASGAPPNMLSVSLKAPLASKTGFSFDDIDVAAYPHAAIPGTRRPCAASLEQMAPADWRALLLAAGRHRIAEKSRQFAAKAKISGDVRQTFYEECLAMLGAKKNAAAFRKTAHLMPISDLDRAASVEDAYAMLLGTAGLLPQGECDDAEAASFAKRLWDAFFKSGGGASRRGEDFDWDFSGTRPPNHPVRRFAAAAAMFCGKRDLHREIAEIGAPFASKEWHKEAIAILCGDMPGFPFWERRRSFDSAPSGKPLALLGKARASAIVTNVAVPMMISAKPELEGLLSHLPPEDLGAPARETANRLFGRDHNAALYASNGLLQQGLLAIFRAFCIESRNGCSSCPLAAQLARSV